MARFEELNRHPEFTDTLMLTVSGLYYENSEELITMKELLKELVEMGVEEPLEDIIDGLKYLAANGYIVITRYGMYPTKGNRAFRALMESEKYHSIDPHIFDYGNRAPGTMSDFETPKSGHVFIKKEGPFRTHIREGKEPLELFEHWDNY